MEGRSTGPDLGFAADGNLAAAWRETVGEWSGSTAEDDELLLVASGLPEAFFNPVIVKQPCADPEAAVDRIVDFFSEHEVPFFLWLREGLDPTLESVAGVRGLRVSDGPPLMAMAPIVDDPGNPPGLEIVLVTADTMEDTIAVSAAGNQMPFEYASAFLPVSVLKAEGVAAFLARVDGEPVATSMLVLTDDVAGVYAVSTVPAHRKKGYGEAVSRAAVREGRARGATVSILQSSAMGRPVYERMGFEMIGRYRVIQPFG